MCVCGTICTSVRELEPDDGWSVLTRAAQWTVRLDVAGLPPSLSPSLPLCFTPLLHFLRAKHAMLPVLTHAPSPRFLSSYSALSCSLTFSGVVGQMEA